MHAINLSVFKGAYPMTTVFDFLFYGILGSAAVTHITIFPGLLTTSYPLPSNTLFIQKMTTVPHLMAAIREVRARFAFVALCFRVARLVILGYLYGDDANA